MFGFNVQLYGVRSETSWGFGDFNDLKNIIEQTANLGADFILTNPLNLLYMKDDFIEPSPYLPSSRFELNPMYISPQNIEEVNNTPELKAMVDQEFDSIKKINYSPEAIDYLKVWKLKENILKKIFQTLKTDFSFNDWLQFQARKQLKECQKFALKSQMKIGLISDLPIGVHPDGIIARQHPEYFINQLNVGVPPDSGNPLGQNWGQHPLDWRYLEKHDYNIWKAIVKSIFSYSGGVRIDHVAGLFRLWCIPVGNPPQSGAYITQNYKKIIEIFKEQLQESTNNQGLLIGEDLGTVPTIVRKVMKKNSIYRSYIMAHTLNSSGYIQKPSFFKPKSFNCIFTHDQAPINGYLNKSDIEIKNQLDLIPDVSKSMKDREKSITAFKNQFHCTTNEEIILKLHQYLASTKSKLKCINLYDLVKQTKAVNIPGTHLEYSNWSVPLQNQKNEIVMVDEIFKSQFAQDIVSYFHG